MTSMQQEYISTFMERFDGVPLPGVVSERFDVACARFAKFHADAGREWQPTLQELDWAVRRSWESCIAEEKEAAP